MSSSEQSNKPTSASPEHAFPPSVVAYAHQPFNGTTYATPPTPGSYPPPFFAYPPPPDANHVEGQNGVPPHAPPYMMAFPPPPGMVYAFPPPPGQGTVRISLYHACSHPRFQFRPGLPLAHRLIPSRNANRLRWLAQIVLRRVNDATKGVPASGVRNMASAILAEMDNVKKGRKE